MDTEEMVDFLDNNPLCPNDRSDVSYEILSLYGPNEPIFHEVFEEKSNNFSDKRKLSGFRNVIHSLRFYENRRLIPSYSLLWGVLESDSVLDGVLAEYYIGWGVDLGIKDRDIVNIILNKIRVLDS